MNNDLISRATPFKSLLIYEMIKGTQDAPAVDAEPVKRGEWITSEKPGHMATIRCSECGTMYQRRFKAQYNFCPECGADMRGVKNG